MRNVLEGSVMLFGEINAAWEFWWGNYPGLQYGLLAPLSYLIGGGSFVLFIVFMCINTIDAKK